ncbi:MAG: phosphotransferase family protein, partial [Nocardioidaceae bacterium]
MTATTLADPVRLGEWLGPRLPGSGPVQVRRHPEGHSNLTYVVSRAGTDGSGGSEWILRRPPAGPLLPTAHDVVREYHVLDLLARGDSSARAPRVVAVCEDPDVIGAPFYLMERVDGVVIREQPPDWLDGPARRDLGLDLAEALAEIHATPTEPFVAAGL